MIAISPASRLIRESGSGSRVDSTERRRTAARRRSSADCAAERWRHASEKRQKERGAEQAAGRLRPCQSTAMPETRARSPAQTAHLTFPPPESLPMASDPSATTDTVDAGEG
jgi:hypothetical protein